MFFRCLKMNLLSNKSDDQRNARFLKVLNGAFEFLNYFPLKSCLIFKLYFSKIFLSFFNILIH